MTISFDRDSLVVFAGLHATSPSGTPRLRDVLAAGLGEIPPPSPITAFDLAIQRARVRRLKDRCSSGASTSNERTLRYLPLHTRDIADVFKSYAKCLPEEWQRWLWWAHGCYEHAVPSELPILLEAIEALIAVEPQLHVDGGHPNRDHVVHQLADAEVAVKLHMAARPGFDEADWLLLTDCVPNLRPSHRDHVTRAGLALAGMFHDIGYLRYVGASARQALGTGFGIVAPAPSFDLWQVMETFAGSYLDQILGDHGRSDGLVADVFRFAWDAGWHGPLSALVLASAARRMVLESRSSARLAASLQIAAASAFLHELHPTNAEHLAAPSAINEARARIAAFAWPALFRIVDELQCWGRPKLVPAVSAREATLDFGAVGAELNGNTMRLFVPNMSVAKKEERALRFLCNGDGSAPGPASAIFAALGITTIARGYRQ